MAISEDALWTYLEQKMGLDRGEISNDTLLFSSNVLDSFSMVDMIMFIEKEAGVRLSPSEVSLDNLDSVDRIVAFLEIKQRA